MAIVRLSGQLRTIAGGPDQPVVGDTVLAALMDLEAAQPAIAGWVLDERRRVRRHLNIFVDGNRGREETSVNAESRIHVLPSITGGMK